MAIRTPRHAIGPGCARLRRLVVPGARPRPARATGLPLIFDTHTDFSRLLGAPGIHVDHLYHSARFTWRARPGPPLSRPLADPASITLHVDRPFQFVATERVTGAIVFIGRVSAP
ncbi:MAG: serpin family protein [Polyangiaceae bacterium]